MKKRIISSVLAAVLFVTSLSIPAFGGALGGTFSELCKSNPGRGRASTRASGFRISIQQVDVRNSKGGLKDYDPTLPESDPKSWAAVSTAALQKRFSKGFQDNTAYSAIYNFFYTHINDTFYVATQNETNKYYRLANAQQGGLLSGNYDAQTYGLGDYYNSSCNAIVSVSAFRKDVVIGFEEFNKGTNRDDMYYPNYFLGNSPPTPTDPKHTDVTTIVSSYMNNTWKPIAQKIIDCDGDISYLELKELAEGAIKAGGKKNYIDMWKYICDGLRCENGKSREVAHKGIASGGVQETFGLRVDKTDEDGKTNAYVLDDFIKGSCFFANCKRNRNVYEGCMETAMMYAYAYAIDNSLIGPLDHHFKEVSECSTITWIPVIYIESLVCTQDGSNDYYAYTLGQFTGAAVGATMNNDFYKNLYYNRDKVYSSQIDILNAATGGRECKAELQAATYGFMMDKNGKPMCFTDKWRTSKGNLWLEQRSVTSNRSTVMAKYFNDIYEGYSFHWPTIPPCSTDNNASFGISHTAAWVDDDGAVSKDHKAENGDTSINREAYEEVDDDGFYIVKGDKDLSADAVSWLSKQKNDPSYNEWWIELKVGDSILVPISEEAVVADTAGVNYTPNNYGIKAAKEKELSYKDRDVNAAGYKALISRTELIEFLKGNRIVKFLSPNFHSSYLPNAGTYKSQSIAYCRITPVSNVPYAWSESMKDGLWVSDKEKTIEVVIKDPPKPKPGNYTVYPDVKYPSKTFDRDIGYYTWTADDTVNEPWDMNMKITKLSELLSTAKTIENDADLGKITVYLDGYTTYTPFYKANGDIMVGFSRPSAISYDSKVLTELSKLMKQAAGRALSENSADIKVLTPENVFGTSNTVTFTGEDAREFIRVIQSGQEWGITGKVRTGTKQNIEARISGTFTIGVKWERPNKAPMKYELQPETMTSSYVYPCTNSKLAAKAYYSVVTDPISKAVDLTDFDTDSYTMGEYLTNSMGAQIHETSAIDVTFGLDKAAKASYSKIANNSDTGACTLEVYRAKPNTKGEVDDEDDWELVDVTLNLSEDRADVPNSLRTYFRELSTPGRFEWSGTAGFGDFMQAIMEEGATLRFEDEFEGEGIVLNAANPEVSFLYRVVVTMDADYKTADGLILTKHIAFDGRPDRGPVHWYLNKDLIFNSTITENYAEFKHNVPMLERYEAMSGVPVTENLYYSTGGHEFVVQSTYRFESSAAADRTYSYTAIKTACVDSWIVTKDTSLNCIDIDECGGHTYYTTGTAMVAGTCKPICKQTHDENCPEGCTEEHAHQCTPACYEHTGYTAASVGGVTTKKCTASGWDPVTCYTLSTTTCPTCGMKMTTLEESKVSCSGQYTDTYSTYINVTDDGTDATAVTHTYTHCVCHCPKGKHWECNPDLAQYSESWETHLTGIKYMQIVKCAVWKLEANRLEANPDLVSSIDAFEGSQVADEHGNDVYTVKLYYWAGDPDTSSTEMCIKNRFVYFWQPDQHQFIRDMYGNLVAITDDVDLNETSVSKNGYAGDSGTLTGTLYTNDECKSVKERCYDTYVWLHDQYLEYIELDLGGADSWDDNGHRFGGTCTSDFLVLVNHEGVDQAVYYHDYSIYAGGDKTTADYSGTSLYELAQFGTSRYKEGATKDPEKSTIDCTGCYRYRHYTNEDMSRTVVTPDHKTISCWSVDGFWGFNETCHAFVHDTIYPHSLYIGGYNGKYSSYEDKYTGTGMQDSGESTVDNFEFNDLSFLCRNWKNRFMGGYLNYFYRNVDSEEADFAVGYDNGTYFTLDDNQENHAIGSVHPLTLYPDPESLPEDSKFRLVADNIDIRNQAMNGVYEQLSSQNFYAFIFSDKNPYPNHRIDSSNWANRPGFTTDTYYCFRDQYESSSRHVNEVVVYVPMAADIDLEIVRFDDGPMENIEFRDDRIASQRTTGTGINLEADGWVHFPLVSYIKEANRNRGLYKPVDYITDVTAYTNNYETGYGGLDGSDNPLEVSQWCSDKWVVFDNYVIVDTNCNGSFADERVYPPGEPIYLRIKDDYGNPVEWYHIYLPEMAWESTSTTVDFYSQAMNYNGNENPEQDWSPNNIEDQYGYDLHLYRYHGASDDRSFQVVGRIGNLTMTDTGDFRYSNFFKNVLKDKWLIDNVVYEVNPNEQTRVVIDEYDIFGTKGGGTDGWNTYGSQGYKGSLPTDKDNKSLGIEVSNQPAYEVKTVGGVTRRGYYALPLIPSYNNISAFRDNPVRIGYASYMDIETIGNYYSGDNYVTVEWSYYGMLDNNNLEPLDVYMEKDGKYVLINDFDNNNLDSLYSYPVYMKWQDENARRMYTTEESKRTDEVEMNMDNERKIDVFTGDPVAVNYYKPFKETIYQGNCDSAILGFDSRTFIGNEYFSDVIPGFSDNNHTDPGDYTEDWLYYLSSQKWYFSNQLPSTAVFVKSNEKCDEKTVEVGQTRYKYIVVTAYIQSHGNVWTLQHDGTPSWIKLRELFPPTDTDPPLPPINPPTPGNPPIIPIDPVTPTPPDPPTVIEVIPPSDYASSDITSSGTH